jgi:hypothetical protein
VSNDGDIADVGSTENTLAVNYGRKLNDRHEK